LEVVKAGAPLPLGGHRQRAVLARLLLDASRVVPTDSLIDALWGDDPPATSVKTLQKYISELRKVLGSQLRTDPAGYVVTAGDLDARHFERLVADARRARSAGDLQGAAAKLAAARALWRGPVLADFDEPFVAPERARLDELRVAAVEQQLELDLALGRHREAAGELSELVGTHPLRERLWSLLMLALYRSGRQADALRAYDRVRRLLRDELGLDPSPELRQLQSQILRNDPSLVLPSSAPTNLPHPLTSFVGREEFLTALSALLEHERLITLIGTGGVGKTRLAIEVARRAVPAHPGGVWMAELAPVRDPDLVAAAVAGAVGVGEQPERELLDVLADALAHRHRALIVLDNCEHLIAVCATLVRRLVGASPTLRVLATSREPLGITGEATWLVPPLTVPAGDSSADETTRAEAIRLFEARARSVWPGFSLDRGNLEAVGAVCRHLDGLPLAIELAASQVRVLDPGQIAAHLNDRFRLLQQRPQHATDRHRSLRAAVEWSHELLSDQARRVFARLAVFAGSFTLDGAQAVAGGGDVLQAVTELVDKSLLRRDPACRGVARYRYLETLRLYALEQLIQGGCEHDARMAHLDFHQELIREATPHMEGPQELAWRQRLEAEEHEFDAALEWTRAHAPVAGLRLAVSLRPYWFIQSRGQRGAAALISALDAAPKAPPLDRAWALTFAADLSADHGDAREAPGWAERAITIFRRAGDRRGQATAQRALGSGLLNSGQIERADRVTQGAIQILDDLGDVQGGLRARYLRGSVALQGADYQQAQLLYAECLAGWTGLGSPRGRARSLRMLGAVACYQGELEAAAWYCEESLALFSALGDGPSVTHAKSTLADVRRLSGKPAQAQVIYEEVLEQFRSFGDRRCTGSMLRNLGVLACGRQDHDSATGLFLDSMSVRYELGDDTGIAEVLEGLAGSVLARRELKGAAVLLSAASSIRQAGHVPPAPADQGMISQHLAGLRRDLGEKDFRAAWSEGATLDVDAAVAYAQHMAAGVSYAGHGKPVVTHTG
jgi:predicted ATPase/DNA-binding SARP family transcriptional activator